MTIHFHSLKELYTKLTNDPEFAKQFRADPQKALALYKIQLSPEDLNLVLKNENPLSQDQDLEKRESK